MPVGRFASEYNMRHPKCGMVIIFNHEHFKIMSLKSRTGTNVDCENLRQTLEDLQFEVTVKQDLSYKAIQKCIKAISKTDHSEHDCLLISILSHSDLGFIYAKDTHYKLESIWSYFTAEKCPTLGGKPKLFFIQACQSNLLPLNGDVKLNKTETDNGDSQFMFYRIPINPVFLIAYSTIPETCNEKDNTGSVFVQCLCQEMKQNGKKYDLFTLLTFVNQRVAIDCESNTSDSLSVHQKSQIPCITTMLTRLLHFHEK